MGALLALILPNVLPNIATSILTGGLSPLLGWAFGQKTANSKTLTIARSVQGASTWAVLLPILYSSDLWFSILPPIQGFIADNYGETLVGGGVAVVLSIVFEVMRRVSTGPVQK